jgi:hypothetical protein
VYDAIRREDGTVVSCVPKAVIEEEIRNMSNPECRLNSMHEKVWSGREMLRIRTYSDTTRQAQEQTDER